MRDPLPEDEAPNVNDVVELVTRLEDRLRAGEKVWLCQPGAVTAKHALSGPKLPPLRVTSSVSFVRLALASPSPD